MNSLVLEAPAMYADHHVQEVRRILLEMPGIEDVNASSAFHAVEVAFDPERIAEDAIRKALSDSGYMSELVTPAESGLPAFSGEGNGEIFYRHSESIEAIDANVGFEQAIPNAGRPLWPCPGINRADQVEE
jgi:copper chaperone CopZ